MKSEDMKIKKFEILVRDIDKYLGGTCLYRIIEDEDEEHVFNFFFDRNKNNPWIEGLFNNTFTEGRPLLCDARSRIEKDNIMGLVSRIRNCNSCRYNGGCNSSYHLMFWLIFMVSVDNDNFNNNLSLVADMAYLLYFSEDMLEDWITAVKGVLSGKSLKELSYKTEVGKAFFVR